MMDPEFIHGFERVCQRYDAFWNLELIDRPPVHLVVERESPRWPVRPLPDNPEALHLDPQAAIDLAENHLATTDYWAEGMHCCARGTNTAYIGSFCGAQMKFEPGTVWVEPTVEDWDAAPRPEFRTDTELFGKIVQVSDALYENARGRYMLELPDHIDATTTAMQLRGLDETMIDLIDAPDAFARYCREIEEVWKHSYDWWKAYDASKGYPGLNGWHRLYSTHGHTVIQSDFSALISPEMFERHVKGEMDRCSRHVGRACYHLDGVGELPHLEHLLELDCVTHIQWQPGDGKPSCSGWMDLLKRIQAAGKGLQLFCWPHDIEPLVQNLSPKGVMLFVVEKQDATTARWILDQVERWGTQA